MARRKRRSEKRNQQSGRSPQEVLIKALNHPVRVKVLEILTDRVASPKGIAEEIETPLSNVSYHVRVLDELGLIEIVEEETVRGSVAHFYRAVERPLIDNPSWNELDPKVRGAVSGHVLESLITDAADSLAAGIFDQRENRRIIRTPLLLDEEGWRNVSQIQAQAIDSIFKEQTAAASRLSASDAKRIHAILGMLLFELRQGAES